MSERRVTMADVARKAGVSPTTASFALSGRTDMRISDASRERVLEAARELGYRPNVTARSLRTKSTQTIGFVSDRITTTPFAGDVIRGAMEAARERDHLLFITEAGGDRAAESSLVHALLDRQVDAVIYASMFTRYVTPPKELFGRRVVLLNCLAPGFDAPSVVPDEFEAGRDAARALLAAGQSEGIWAIGGHQAVPATPEGIIAGNERMRGLEESFGRAGHAWKASSSATGTRLTATERCPPCWRRGTGPARWCVWPIGCPSAPTRRLVRQVCRCPAMCRSSRSTIRTSRPCCVRRSPRYGCRTTNSGTSRWS